MAINRVFNGATIYVPGFYGDPNQRKFTDEELIAVRFWGTLAAFGIAPKVWFYKTEDKISYSLSLTERVEESHSEWIAHFRKK